MRFALYHVHNEHIINRRFSKDFYHQLLTNVIAQIDVGSNWYHFLSLGDIADSEVAENDGEADSKQGKQITLSDKRLLD